MTNRTISPEDAEDLACARNGAMAGDWCREADVHVESRRWQEYRALVLRHDDGTLWGLRFARGLTENQESDFPWRDTDGPLPLVRLYRTEEIAVRYVGEPPVDPDVPAVLVDRVYDLLYAALAGHNLITCPTTETGPANGIEATDVHDIAERVVRSLRTAEVAS